MQVALSEETVDADETLDRFGIDSVVRLDPTAHLSRQLFELICIVTDRHETGVPAEPGIPPHHAHLRLHVHPRAHAEWRHQGPPALAY
jgi:hypothetical protein